MWNIKVRLAPLTDDIRAEILKEADQLNQQGLVESWESLIKQFKGRFCLPVEDEKRDDSK